MPRGGYQKPSDPAPVSGPGRFSRRTDGGTQPISEPDIDTPGLEYGDRSGLVDAQRIAKAAAGQGAAVGPQRMTGQPGTGAKLPPFLFDSESQNPLEPGSAGLGMGPGPGPEALAASQPAEDVREVVLEYLVQTFGNKAAAEMLAAIRAEKAVPVAAPVGGPTLNEDVPLPAEPVVEEPAPPPVPA